MNQQQWAEIFWLIAVLPAVGIGLWLALSAKATRSPQSA